MAKGFPRANEPARSVRFPVEGGSLMDYMRRNFPAVAAKVEKIPRDGVYDYHDAKFARKFPQRSGRYRKSP